MPAEPSARQPKRAAVTRKDKPEDDEAAPSARGVRHGGGRAQPHIELPPGARDRIAELLWTGGSLIVSDNGRSDEMDEYNGLHRPDALSAARRSTRTP